MQVPTGNCACKGRRNEWIAWPRRWQLSEPVWLRLQVRKGAYNFEWAIDMTAVSAVMGEMMPQCWAWKGEATPLCWRTRALLRPVLMPGTHHRLWYRHILQVECKSKREQRLGKRTSALRISETKRTLLDDGCKGWPLPCAAEQELYREGLRHSLLSLGFRKMGGSRQSPEIKLSR